MRIEILYKGLEPVGYDMIPESEEDKEIIGIVRDMYFWPLGDRVLTYAGRVSGEDDSIKKLKWRQIKFAKSKDEEFTK